jgi:ubiquinone/menaquinone biosynthesis C-methylase UbiE
MPTTDRFVPAAGRRGLNALYDPVMALTMRERAWRPALVAQAATTGPRTIADIGCGTGTLAIDLARALPEAIVIGIDGDRAILDQAAAKAVAGGVQIDVREGLAQQLPVADDTADVVVMSLLLHHLTTENKLLALREARRVLRPEGRLLIADWGQPRDPLTAATFLALRLLDGWQQTAEHAAARLPKLIASAGLHSVDIFAAWTTGWGRLELISAHTSIEGESQ